MPTSKPPVATTSLKLVGRLAFERDRWRFGQGNANSLIPSATQNQYRQRIPLLDRDFHRNVSNYGRRTLLSLGRHIFYAYPPIRQAVTENARFAGSHFLPEYRGTDSTFKGVMETLLWDHDRWADVAGPPYSMALYRMNQVKAILIDGDIGTIYVRDPKTGFPYLQVIPGHRIYSDPMTETVEFGPWAGRTILDGVIVDNYLRPLAYRVYQGEIAEQQFVDISAMSMSLSFVPHFPGQIRGVSEIGLAAWDIQDLSESNRFELLAQKAGAGRVFVETNEEGEPPPGAEYITAPSSGSDGSSTPSGLWYETVDQGVNTYFKAGTGSGLEAVRFDRPTSNQQGFSQARLREILGVLGTSYDFALDMTKIGGHGSRVMLEKINRNLASLRDLAIEPAARRFDGFRIATFMETGDLPFTSDWHLIEYQGPAEWTGDRKHDADVDAQEIRIGVKTRTKSAGQRGESLVDVREAREREADDLFTRARRLADAHQISFELALSKLEDDGVSVGQFTTDQAEPNEPKLDS